MPGERLMPEGTTGPEGEAKFTPIDGSLPDSTKPPEKLKSDIPVEPPKEAVPEPDVVEEPLSETPIESVIHEDLRLSPDELELITKYRSMKDVEVAKVDKEGKPIRVLPPEVTQEVVTEAEARNRLIEAERQYRQILEQKKEKDKQQRERTGETKEPPPWEEEEYYHQGEAPRRDGFFLVRILDQMGRQMWVYWPKDEAEARARVRDVVGRIELAREDVDPQLSLEYQRIQAILGSIKARKEFEEGHDEKTGKDERLIDHDQISKIKEFNERLGLEFKGRRAFHQAFFSYETQSSLEAVTKAAVSLGPNDFNALFEIEETSKKDGQSFNPFVQALQFYEDHGHEFARHNSEELRPFFGNKVLLDLKEQFGGDVEDYKWAQNMAERFFRFSGRAIEYDYLVYHKGESDEQRVIFLDPDKHPITGELNKGEKVDVDWASDRDGCDYDQSKNLRNREFLRAEKGLRANIKLLDGIDTFGGDFLTRTVSASTKDTPFITYRVKDEEEKRTKVEAKTKELIEKNNKLPIGERKTPEELRKEMEKLEKLYDVLQPVSEKEKEAKTAEKIKELTEKNEKLPLREKKKSAEEIRKEAENEVTKYYSLLKEVDLAGDRETTDNRGEEVGHLDFRLLQRTKIVKSGVVEKDNIGKIKYDGFNFKKMGTTTLGLWVTRYVNGPEALRNALMGKADSYLINPNTESLRALINAWDFEKGKARENIRQLAINFIMYAKNEREQKTGKPKFDKTAIVGMVNDLTGLTDPNKPAFFNLNDKKEILEKVLGKHFALVENISFGGHWLFYFLQGILFDIFKRGFSDLGK